MRIGWAKRRDENKVWKGLAAGLVGGLVASWAMSQTQGLLNKLSSEDESSKGKNSKSSSRKKGNGASQSNQRQSSKEEEPATVKVASTISEEVFDHELSKSEKKAAGPAIHYAFGTTVGGLYGVAAELAPNVTVGAGLPFGTAVWLGADEAVLPLLGISKSPTQYPLSTHAYALASHFVYGLTTEMVRRALRGAMSMSGKDWSRLYGRAAHYLN